jgi:type I restriction enzyme S subunit
MTRAKHLPFAELGEVIAGQHIPAEQYDGNDDGTPYLTGPADFTDRVPRITKWTKHPRSFALDGDVLLTVKCAGCGKSNLSVAAAIGRQLMALRPDPSKLDRNFLFAVIRSQEERIARLGQGATVPGIAKGDIEQLQIPWFPLAEQRRIAAILDKADRLQRLTRFALYSSDGLIRSSFLRQFGDPKSNEKNWKVEALADLCTKFSDGPFGSNLKSEHYKPEGIRVVRLQNIGVGTFMDDDRAFISTEHFAGLRKRGCSPGDVLIGTLGDPNLRACVQPKSLSVALNKADCVQARPDPDKITGEYLCWLLNMPSTLFLTPGLVHG